MLKHVLLLKILDKRIFSIRFLAKHIKRFLAKACIVAKRIFLIRFLVKHIKRILAKACIVAKDPR